MLPLLFNCVFRFIFYIIDKKIKEKRNQSVSNMETDMYDRQETIMKTFKRVLNVFLAINMISFMGDIATIITRFSDLISGSET